MTYDYSKLRGKIVEVYGSNREFAKVMEWSERTLSLKMNSKSFWKQNDIRRAATLLGIDQDRIGDYFFAIKVQKN